MSDDVEVVKILGDLGAHDIGHVIKFADHEGVLTRVLHEGGSSGIRPTYLTLQVDGLTAIMTGRFDHDLPVTVLPRKHSHEDPEADDQQ